MLSTPARTNRVLTFAAVLLTACAGDHDATGPLDSQEQPLVEDHDADLRLRASTDDTFAFAVDRLRQTVAFVKATHPTDFMTYYPTHTFASGAEVGRWDFVPRTSPLVSSRVQDWRSGFFPGTLWLAYRETGARDIVEFARNWTAGIEMLKDTPIDHDLGSRFLYSFGRALRDTCTADDVTGTYRAHAREMLLAAAATLDSRFDMGGIQVGAIRAEDDYPEGPYPVYVDSMVNVPLLFEAAALSEHPQSAPARTWYEHAITHASTVLRDNVRADGSTYHIARYNDGTFGTSSDGRLYDKITDQGYGNETTWSRGQAWAIYGFATVYRYTRGDASAKPQRFLQAAQRAADYFIARLPANDSSDTFNHRAGDFVPPSDFDAARGEPAGPYNDANGDHVFGDRKPATQAWTERDSSAAAVAAAGLLELSELSTASTDRGRYRRAARDILLCLLTFRGADGNLLYLAKAPSPQRGLLANGSVAWGSGTGSLIYGDYFLLEALSHYRKQ